MLTKSNIAYNLEISPHRLTVEYDTQFIEYYFSSNLYKTKFIEKFKPNRDEIAASLHKRFGFVINSDMIADLRLYNKIEKRGFLVETSGGKFKCPHNIKLDGQRMTMND